MTGYIGIDINEISKSTDENGNVYNGKGWKDNYYIDRTTVYDPHAGVDMTGFIPFTLGQTVYFKNIGFTKNTQYDRINFYDANKQFLGYVSGQSTWYSVTQFNGIVDSNNRFTQMTPVAGTQNGTASGAAYIRISCSEGIDENSIITVGEPAPDISELANEVKKIYIGNNSGKAIRILRAYIGDENGIARLWYDCIAAKPSFPEEPTEYVLIDTYTTSQTWTAPESGYFKVEVHGASGNGGLPATYEFEDDGAIYYKLSTGAGGAGGGYAASIVKLMKGDTIIFVCGAVGYASSATIESGIETYDAIVIEAGGDGGNGRATSSSVSRASGGIAGIVSGGNLINNPGSDGTRGTYTSQAYGEQNFSCPAGGAAGHTDGNKGGRGAGIYRSTAVTDGWTGSEWLPYKRTFGSPGFVKISRGNTNIIG